MANSKTTTKTATFKVVAHTKGAVKLTEVDAKGEETIDLSGSLYLRKSAVGTLPEGTVVTMEVTFPAS